jgi:hypothetical protein
MDVYHKVLVKLYEITGGKDTETVDLKELVKKEGFLGSYPQILEHLSRQSWIIETTRPGSVKISHWGIKEAKNSDASSDNNPESARKEINRMISETRELIKYFEDLANDTSKENIVKSEKKLAEINSAIQKLKESVQ